MNARRSWVTTGIIVLVALLLPSVAEANRNGTAEYDYKVTKFIYAASGSVLAGIGPIGFLPCSTNIASWSASVTSATTAQPSEGSRGELRIGHHGTSGRVLAFTPAAYGMTGNYVRVLSCFGGAPSALDAANCSKTLETNATASALIDGGVGDRVDISWHVGQNITSGWLPRAFKCFQPLEFASDNYQESERKTGSCKEERKVPLSRFTGRRVTLEFKCNGKATFAPPDSIAERYLTLTHISGSVTLKRTRQG